MLSSKVDEVKGPEIVIDQGNGLVHATLNRPAALNALSTQMVEDLGDIVRAHTDVSVLVSGAGGRAFCAGGDIKAAWHGLREGQKALGVDFFTKEYATNKAIFDRKAPYIAFLNGIVMGGGFGVSGHGSHVIATDATSFAMPEVKIGFFPDVGSVYSLAHAKGELGTYLALTGNTVNASDMIYAGLADTYMSVTAFAALKERLGNDDPDTVISDLASQIPEGGILQVNQDVIDECFVFDEVSEIVDALKTNGSLFALQTAEELEQRSIISLVVALEHLRRAKTDDFDIVIKRDLDLAIKFMDNSDFVEGVRAALIDRDRNPQWRPENLGNAEALRTLYFEKG